MRARYPCHPFIILNTLNIMAEEITYIPYGQDEISQQDLMTSLANGISGYLGSKRWAKKDKYRQAWLNAYQDIVGHGLLGASNSSGLWNVQYGQDPIDLSTKSNIEREMYQDAAYYIQQQMSQMPLHKKEEEKKKEDLEQYNFTKQFLPQIYNNRYGGNQDLFASEWETLDERGDNGLRGTDKRKAALIEELNKYRQNLIDNRGKYNFEGTAFKDEDDVIRRIDEAVAAIQSPDLADDNPKLNALGLSYNSFFSNGGNDIYGTDKNGNKITYQQYYDALDKQKEAEAKAEEEELKKKKQAVYNNTLFFNRVTNPKMFGQNAQALKDKYKDHNTLFAALQGYAQKDIRTLSPQEQSEVQGAYRYLANQPIDNTTLKNLQSSSSGLYKNAAPNRFRKIKGIDNLIWDSVANQVIQINSRQQQEAYKNQPEDLFANVKTQQDVQDDYMNSTEGGFTPAEQREVAALLFDLGAAADPEGFSSAGLSQIASGIRDYNRATDPEGWTWGDTGWATLDHGLGLLSLFPVAGGWIKGAWAAEKLGKYIPKMEKAIRYLGRAGSTYAMATNAPGALNTLNKIKNGEDLSLKDYQDLAYFFIGGLGHHQLNRGNRVERSAMKARGVETSNSVLNKAGITRTKAKTTSSAETTPTLKVQKTGENGKVETKEIPINEKQQKALSKTKVEDLETKAKELEIEIPEGYKIQPKSTTTKTWSRENLNRYRGKAHSEIFGTQTQQKQTSGLKSDEEFEQYLAQHNNTWLKKIINGSNRDIRKYDRYLGNNVQKQQESTQKSSENTSKSTEQKELSQREQQYNKATINRYKEHLKGNFSNKKLQSGDYNLNGNNLRVVEQQDGTFNIIYKGDIKGNYQKHQQKELQQKVFDLVKENRKTVDKQSGKSTKKSTAEIGKILQDLKKKGWLKRGGTINTPIDNIIEDFFKYNNI